MQGSLNLRRSGQIPGAAGLAANGAENPAAQTPVDKAALAPANRGMPEAPAQSESPPPSPAGSGPSRSTFDPAEVDRFRRIASEWWDQRGKFAPLHKLGPARLQFIRDRLTAHFGREGTIIAEQRTGQVRSLAGLSVLDIGCGGGLISEPAARMGARVTGIDPGRENIEAARRHATDSGLTIDYRETTVEALLATGATFDAVLCLEVIEHVPDPAAFLTVCAGLVRPGGLMIVSTINRTVKAYLLAIVGAEYVLRWLPAGTHQWERFVTPDELARHLAAAGLGAVHTEGMVYSPFTDTWSLSADTDVNYLSAAGKSG